MSNENALRTGHAYNESGSALTGTRDRSGVWRDGFRCASVVLIAATLVVSSVQPRHRSGHPSSAGPRGYRRVPRGRDRCVRGVSRCGVTQQYRQRPSWSGPDIQAVDKLSFGGSDCLLDEWFNHFGHGTAGELTSKLVPEFDVDDAVRVLGAGHAPA